MVDGKTVLITGCGSLAKALTKHMLLECKPKKIILYSRNEYLQSIAMGEIHDPKHLTRYFIGDVRDLFRLQLAARGVDIVIHTAAMKRVESAEYNPSEAIATNVDGTWNVIQACINTQVQRAVFISTDKAVMPVNLYGCTKAVGEKLWLHANYYKPIFNAVRYGNVARSTGSVIPIFEEIAREKREFPVTDVRMSRFWVEMREAVGLVMTALDGKPGYTYALDSPTFKIVDLAKAMYARAKIKEVGNRGSEKLHETLVGAHEATRTTKVGDVYQIAPEFNLDDSQPSQGNVEELTSEKGNMSIAQIREKLK